MIQCLIFTTMKIVILDAYALNPGDLSWESLEKFGNLVIYDRSSPGETPERIKDADIVLTNKAIVNSDAIEGAESLKYIGVMATGFNNVDVKAAKKKGISVSNIPSYSTPSVAQLAFAFIIGFANKLPAYTQSVKSGGWVKSPDFSYMVEPLEELKDKVLGIVGLGRIGQSVARIALAFDMKVIASHKHPQRDKMEGVWFVNESELFEQSDFISLHCPLNDKNKEFVNTALLSKMKPSAYLINTSRGGLINEKNLADALEKGVLAGAGLDVLSTEPPLKDNPLLGAKNCLITPHIAWASKESRLRLMATLERNITTFVNGNPQNVVN